MNTVRFFYAAIIVVSHVLFIDPGTSFSQNKVDSKKILWVDSYQSGYEWSDSIERGIRSALKNSDVELVIHHMDTKNCPDEECIRAAANRTLGVISTGKPDILIASDDNAQKYLVAPYLKDTTLPIVFCGVNWDASVYGYPAKNITGMIEVELAIETVKHMQRFAKGKRIGCLSGDTASDRKNINWLNSKYFNNRMIAYRVKRYDEFKKRFIQLQNEVDMMFFRNNAAIAGWDALDAKKFIGRNIRIPLASNNDWMAPYVVFTLGKIPEEQGQYAAKTALKILEGAEPDDFSIVNNRQANLTVNLEIARAAGIVLPVSLLKVATVIGQERYNQTKKLEDIRKQDFRGKRIFWVDSYHKGYEWSDGIENAIREVLYDTGIELQIIRMNTKRENKTHSIQKVVERARMMLADFTPDIIIASDDNAQKYLIAPYYKNIDIPVVFCGVNLDIAEYGYPAKNITGMIEINPVDDLVTLLKDYAKGDRAGYIAGNTLLQRKLVRVYQDQIFDGKLEYYLVDSWTEFEKRFMEIQQKVDFLLFANYAGIESWNTDAARRITRKYTSIPTGSFNSFMDQWVVCTLAKFPEEQGRYAAMTALQILGGHPIESKPIITNSENRLTVNLGLAQKADVVFPIHILKQARVIQ